MKDVKFPLEYDAFELCTAELQSKLTPMRERFKQLEDSQMEPSFKNKNAKDKKDLEPKKNVKQEPYWFEDGKYELLFNSNTPSEQQ